MSSSADKVARNSTRQRPRVAGQRSRTRPQGQQAHGIPPLPPARPERTEPVAPAAPTRKPAAEAKPAAAAAPKAQASRPRRLLAPLLGVGVAAALLAGSAGLALSDPSGQEAQTRAATSTARTSIEQMLSYNYKSIDAQAARIEGLLTGSFKEEFAQAMDKDIKPLAVKNKTVVQARVSDVGVMEQAEGRVKVLAFVNQATVGADAAQPAVDQNRVIATLTRVGERWLISDVQAF